jgi:hypothetical protein
MKYVLVSTYPKEGTQNIGDKLIEMSTADAIRSFDPTAEISTVWRAEDWATVKDTIADADHLIFACLAIRRNMHTIYPYLHHILGSGVPVSVIAAGTNLQIASPDMFKRGFTAADLDLLKRLSEAAEVFTTRGVLSQAFCDEQGYAGARFSGDVAFLDSRYDGWTFSRTERIERIAISDPHHGEVYVPVFRTLVTVLRKLFPQARIDCALHGVNPAIEAICSGIGVAVHPIYLEPETGLDIYEKYDLHAGFRVHGHVSALKRRIPSYLLEQDGRGADYGATLSRKITVPCYRAAQPAAEPRTIAVQVYQALIARLVRPTPRSVGPAKAKRFSAPSAAATFLGALIAQDAREGFSRFDGLEADIMSFNNRTRAAIEQVCAGRSTP